MESAEAEPPEPCRRVLLVGFMCSGKTVVGEALAGQLGWRFLDFDRELERECGRSVAAIFRDLGEAYFREREAAVGERCLTMDQVVLASGGGWPVGEGRMTRLPPDTLSVWLDVSAREAVRRARRDGPTRPLLGGSDPLVRAQGLLNERAEWYAMAHLTLRTDDRDPQSLAEEIAQHVTGQHSTS